VVARPKHYSLLERVIATDPAFRAALDGLELMALNGGPHFKFTEAISLFVDCETQQEVDDLWERLSAGGEKSRCGWLKDKYGLSWQIIPSALSELMHSKDTAKARRVMDAMMKMTGRTVVHLLSGSTRQILRRSRLIDDATASSAAICLPPLRTL